MIEARESTRFHLKYLERERHAAPFLGEPDARMEVEGCPFVAPSRQVPPKRGKTKNKFPFAVKEKRNWVRDLSSKFHFPAHPSAAGQSFDFIKRSFAVLIGRKD